MEQMMYPAEICYHGQGISITFQNMLNSALQDFQRPKRFYFSCRRRYT